MINFYLFIANFLLLFNLGKPNLYFNYRLQSNHISIAKKYCENHHYNLAAIEFKKALRLGNLNYKNSKDALYSFSIINDHKGVKKIINSINLSHLFFCKLDNSQYCFLHDEILKDSQIVNYLENIDPKNKLIGSLLKRIEINNKYRNDSLIYILKFLNEKDQQIRRIYNDAVIAKLPFSTIDSLGREFDKVDSANFSNFISFIRTNGWPGYSKFGDLAELLLWHCNIEYGFLDSICQMACGKKELDWESYEHFICRGIFFEHFFFKKCYSVASKGRLKTKDNLKLICYVKLLPVLEYLTYYNFNTSKLKITVKYANLNKYRFDNFVKQIRNSLRDLYPNIDNISFKEEKTKSNKMKNQIEFIFINES